MSNINFIFTTEVKGKDVDVVEKIANFFLKPAQYLWNGKKIDLIREGNNVAVQKDLIYKPDERSWLKTVFMICMLVPGSIVGGILKGFAFRGLEDEFIKKCLISNSNNIFTRKGDSAFGTKVAKFIETLRSTSTVNAHLKDNGAPLFLSEITNLHLLFEENQKKENGDWIKNNQPSNVVTNRKILDDISLLWNLSFINLVDHYASGQVKDEAKTLVEINPLVVTFNSDQKSFTEKQKASQRFSFKLGLIETNNGKVKTLKKVGYFN